MRAPALAIVSGLVLAPILASVLACSQQGPSGAAGASPTPSRTPAASSSPTSPSPSPTATANPLSTPYGVLATSGVGQPNYALAIVGVDGRVAATATAAPRSGLQCAGAGPILPFPTVSISNSRVYYLDGNTSVKYVTPGGVLGSATSVPGNGSIGSTFSVSPDDKRIAVVASDYSKNPVSYRIYVEDLAGGGNHVDIFNSSGNVPWAMGWRDGQLVLGITGACTQGGGPFSSSPWEYHLVDATTAVRSATLGSQQGCQVRGLPTPAGALCQRPAGALEVLDWNGNVAHTTGLGSDGQQYYNYALSPSGSGAAGCCGANGNPSFAVYTGNGGEIPGGGDSVGFIDETHILVGGVAVQSQSRIFTTTSLASTPVSALGFFVGRLPGGLAPGHGT